MQHMKRNGLGLVCPFGAEDDMQSCAATRIDQTVCKPMRPSKGAEEAFSFGDNIKYSTVLLVPWTCLGPHRLSSITALRVVGIWD